MVVSSHRNCIVDLDGALLLCLMGLEGFCHLQLLRLMNIRDDSTSVNMEGDHKNLYFTFGRLCSAHFLPWIRTGCVQNTKATDPGAAPRSIVGPSSGLSKLRSRKVAK